MTPIRLPVGPHVHIASAHHLLKHGFPAASNEAYVYLCGACAENFETPCVGRMTTLQCDWCYHCRLIGPSNMMVPVFVDAYRRRFARDQT
jgi:hypothetical protein